MFALAIVAAVLPAQGVGALAAEELGASSAWVPLSKGQVVRCTGGSSPGGGVVADSGAVSVLNGEPSLINYLDALNGWQLVPEAEDATACPPPRRSNTCHLLPAALE